MSISSSGVRPHRRILLTQGAGLEAAPPAAAQIAEPTASPAADPANFVRVVAYLTPDEMQKLDTAWIQLRGKGIAANKADIMRAALMITVSNPDALADFLKPAPAAAPQKSTGSPRRRTTP